MPRKRKLNTPEDLRAMLLGGIEAVIEGRMNVPQANAVAALAHELHVSQRQQWDQAVYAAERLTIHQSEVVDSVMTTGKAALPTPDEDIEDAQLAD